MIIPTATLRDGQRIPRLIRGGWQIDPRVTDGALEALAAFVRGGMTCFEVSDSYPGSEALLGHFLAGAAATLGAERAAAIRVHTRYTPDLSAGAPTAAAVGAAVDGALLRLGQARLDLLQLQWWDFDVPGLVETASALADWVIAGKLRGLGVTNLDAAHLTLLIEAGVPVLTNQVQFSLVDRRPAGALAQVCSAHDVALLSYGSLAGGALATRATTGDAPAISDEYQFMVAQFGGWGLLRELLEVLAAVATRHDASIAAVSLHWVLGQDHVAAALVGLSHPRRLADTLQAFDIALDEADKTAIDAVLARAVGPRGEVAGLERDKDGVFAAIIRASLAAKAAEKPPD